ncbi:MAG: glycosyltransferase family protein [Sulfuritalea sp.]|nr:glycosyltransferase family protein [Sulfuritalea sp.]
MTTAVIVQARLGSSRLPGKVLKPLAGGTVLEEVLRRCRAIPGADLVVCAVPEGGKDDPVAAEARRCGAIVTRGSETDVLDRYLQASKAVGAAVVMRITSDCPLIDPEVCGAVLELRAAEDADYACNNLPPSFPHGLDCEAFTRDALEMAWREAIAPEDREHVTPWLRRAPEIRRAVLAGPVGNFAHLRWTLDFPEDYDFFKAVFALMPTPTTIPGWQELAAKLKHHPEIAAINSQQCQR